MLSHVNVYFFSWWPWCLIGFAIVVVVACAVFLLFLLCKRNRHPPPIMQPAPICPPQPMVYSPPPATYTTVQPVPHPQPKKQVDQPPASEQSVTASQRTSSSRNEGWMVFVTMIESNISYFVVWLNIKMSKMYLDKQLVQRNTKVWLL